MLTEQEVYERIIWSADVANVEALLSVLDAAPKLRLVKIDRLFVELHGSEIIRELWRRGINAFYDAKFSEIPSKLEKLAEVGCSQNPWMLNCMAGSLSGGLLKAGDLDEIEGLKRFADTCHRMSVRPCAVTVLTSKTPAVVAEEFGGRDSDEQVLFYVQKLQECGFTDVVCSPKEVPIIRTEGQFDKLDLNTPGIKRKASGSSDQARTSTPAGALAAGSTRLVIGRDITRGDNPAQNLEDIVAEVLAAQI